MSEQKTNIRVVRDAGDAADARLPDAGDTPEQTAPGTPGPDAAAQPSPGAVPGDPADAAPAGATDETADEAADEAADGAPDKARAKTARKAKSPAGKTPEADPGQGADTTTDPSVAPGKTKPKKGAGSKGAKGGSAGTAAKGNGAPEDGGAAARPGAKDKVRPAPPVRPVAPPAKIRSRHWGILFGLLLLVAVPIVAATWYVYERAVDQYASTVGFTVRSEDVSSAVDILGGLGTALGGGGGGSSDSDILYEFIRSQELVTQVDARLDLRSLYSRHFDEDPIFGFDPAGSIEDLTDYWQRMVRISYDANSGLMELRVLAFAPGDAQAIATGIVTASSEMINDLSAIARNDSMHHAVQELDSAVEELKDARQRVTAYRSRTQIVDPGADIRAQMGLLSSLQEQLGRELISLDLLRGETRKSDPRIVQGERRVAAIEARIQDERRKFGVGGAAAGGRDYASLIEEYERLTVDLEFAERKYTSALTGFDTARADAQRQSRYLAAYLRPTLAETAEHPRRMLLTGLVGLFLFLAWATLSLTGYALRDRR